jgi:hypothetical protein
LFGFVVVINMTLYSANQAILLGTIGPKNFATIVYEQNPEKQTLQARIHAYLGLATVNFIKKMVDLDITDYKTHPSWSPEWIYISLVSRQSANHPWVAACNIYSGYFEVYRPFGRDPGQISIEQFNVILANTRFNKAQYYGFYILFSENMRVRKEEMFFSSRHSLLRCENIKQCLLKKKEIAKSRLSPAAKAAEMAKYQAFYEKKCVTFLQKYFDLLDTRNYDEAFAFLRMKHGKYYGKQRLDTFFVSTGEIIGHLQIFIEIYKLIYTVIDRFQMM